MDDKLKEMGIWVRWELEKRELVVGGELMAVKEL
jgi:hypothetical protein